jgi:DNA-directed RNA polymerase III subunit RPC5
MQAIVRDLRQLAAKYASNRKDAQKWQALADAAKSGASLPHEELKTSITEVAVLVHDVFVAKHEHRNSLR